MSEKVLIPALLFTVLSPGIFSSKMTTSAQAVGLHALLFIASYWAIAKALGIKIVKTDLIVPTVLFLLLSPGILLTIPPGGKGLFMSGETSLAAILAHTLVFAVIFVLLRNKFPQFY